MKKHPEIPVRSVHADAATLDAFLNWRRGPSALTDADFHTASMLRAEANTPDSFFVRMAELERRKAAWAICSRLRTGPRAFWRARYVVWVNAL